MTYSPKHLAPGRRAGKAGRATGIVLASAVALGAGVATAGPAKADVGWNVWDDVAKCESSNNWKINTGNGFYGGLQFTHKTWVEFGGTQYASDAHLATRVQQITIAQKVLRKQGPKAWPVCSTRAGLTVANGLAVNVGTTGSSSGKLVVDGILGVQTIKAMQKWVGTTQDGILGIQTKKALQRKVGVTADGIIGKQTVAAIQRKMNIRLNGASKLDSYTVSALQRFFNSYVL